VQFNPTKNNLFLTCGDKGGIELFDLRRFDAPLLKYHTDLCCLGKHSNKLDITGLVWDPSGEFLVANVQLFYPTLYDYNDPFPLATLYDPSFTSLCTIKSGSFSDTMGSLLYFGGSDDATVYGWEIPSLRLLKSKREFTSDTYRNLPLYFNQNISCFPYWIDSKLKLKGHSSVVNSTCSHSSLPYIASAGVEKIVVIHSPIQIKTGIDGESDSRANPDEDVLDYFSHLIRLEKRLWDSRLWNEYL
jgi:WD repeat-containing protein 22